jgi:hypothetical protein
MYNYLSQLLLKRKPASTVTTKLEISQGPPYRKKEKAIQQEQKMQQNIKIVSHHTYFISHSHSLLAPYTSFLILLQRLLKP